ncbi:MAG: phosphatidate cytidylyltransferase [Oscillospiraceae bacterium]|jgi:phosphatidate cytidylyltransferase|nr:phosphatidate cytidylyltransferase [Oscillospiraceae bacterium]
MRVRILTGIVLVLVLVAVCLFLDTLLFNAVICAVSGLGVFELLRAMKLLEFKDLVVLSMSQALIIPFMRAGYVERLGAPIVLAVTLCYFVLMVKNSGRVEIGRISSVFMFSTLIPLFFSCAVYIRDDFSGDARSGFYLFLALGAGWLSDTGAYFVGTFFGRHKMIPSISPKKTWEGTAGGIIFCTAVTLLIGMGTERWLWGAGISARVDYRLLFFLTPLFSVAGMLGDLTASAIKREFGIKDYGNLMPGHGGVLDRFDSVLFTLPAVYTAVRYLEILSVMAD